MAYLKIRHKEQEGYIGGKYHDRDSFHDVISYVLRPEKTPSHYIGGIGVEDVYKRQMHILLFSPYTMKSP